MHEHGSGRNEISPTMQDMELRYLAAMRGVNLPPATPPSVVPDTVVRIADPQTDLPVETLPVTVPNQPTPLVTPPEFVAITDRKKKVRG